MKNLNLYVKYHSTFSGLAQIILVPLFAEFFRKKILNVENLNNSIKATKFKPMAGSTKY
jgi:hypothetical protein